MYSWRQRRDTAVFDEPFYGRYLRQTDPGHPGRDEVIAASRPGDYEECLAPVVAPVPATGAVHQEHRPPPRRRAGRGARPVHQRPAGPGARAAVVAVTGRHARRPDPHRDHRLPPARHDPRPRAGRRSTADRARRGTVAGRSACSRTRRDCSPRLCEAVGVAFDPAMLSWPAGPKPEDGVWAPYWYRSVHRSTGFGPPPTHRTRCSRTVTDDLVAACRPLYEQPHRPPPGALSTAQLDRLNRRADHSPLHEPARAHRRHRAPPPTGRGSRRPTPNRRPGAG